MQNDPKKKFVVPEPWPYQDARELFFQPDVKPASEPEYDFKWEKPDIDGLVQFLVTEKGFSEDRVRSGAAKLEKNLKSTQQSRLDGFFKVIPKTEEQKSAQKRKLEDKNAAQRKKLKDDKKAKTRSKDT